MRLADKVIIVTGSTTGIGEAIVRRCIREGARVLIHGREKDRCQKLLAEFKDSAAASLEDLSDPKSPQRIIDAAVQRFGKLDAIVNNAAMIARSNLYNTEVEFFDKMIAVNVRAPMLLIKAGVEHLKKTKGCVLNIGSINAYCGEKNLLPYSISKGGLLTLSRNLADALAPEGVRVNHFNVGWVLTENEYKYKIQDGMGPNWPNEVDKEHAPSGRLIQPEEIANAACYWLSDESRPFSGTVMELEQYPVIGRNPTKEDAK